MGAACWCLLVPAALSALCSNPSMLLWNKLVSLSSALFIRTGLQTGHAAQNTSLQTIRMASTSNADVAGLNGACGIAGMQSNRQLTASPLLVLGGALRQHGTDPITGFLRDGCVCRI